jgi:ferredoxin
MMKIKRKIIEIDEELCNGCGQCILSCAEGAIELVNGKAKVISDNLCDGLGACIGECPENALKIIERDASEFDEKAVEEHLATIKERPVAHEEKTMACGCSSAHIQMFVPSSAEGANRHEAHVTPASELSHWPVKIKLVSPSAPFLKGADLLIAADCTSFAYAGFHKDFLKEKVVMIGCPKFDDVDAYVQKLADIFMHADIKSITTLIMEVPCCAGMLMLVKKALDQSGKDIPVQEIIISTRGKVKEK